MNNFRIFINGIATFICAWSGAYLLAKGSYFLPGRYHSEFGSLFSGSSLYLLAFSLFFFAAFAASVGLAWLNGSLAMPDQKKLKPGLSHTGRILIHSWYFAAPAFLLLIAAMTLAKRMPISVYEASL